MTINTLKVGVVRTGIRREFPGCMRVMVPLVLDPLLAQTPEQIAASALPLLTDPAYEGTSGKLFIHIKRFKAVEPSARTRDPDTGRRFWRFSERLAARARGRSCPTYPAGKVHGMLSYAPWLARFALLLAAAAFGAVSWVFITNPLRTALSFHVMAMAGAGVTNVRVGFGALPLAASLTILACLTAHDRIREGLSFAAVAVAAVVGVRAEGVLLDGDLRSSLPPLAAGTVLLCLLMTSRWLEDRRRHIAAENVA